MTDPIQFGKGFNPDLRNNQDSLQRDANSSQSTLVQYSRSESTLVTISSATTARPVVASNAVESSSPEQAANNVLQFIAQRLASLKAEGADTQSLESALEKAQQGFARGLAEAREVLQANKRLDDAQEQRLGRVEKRFAEGIDIIERSLRGATDFGEEVAALTRAELGRLAQSPDNKDAVATTTAATSTPTPTVPAPVATVSAPTTAAAQADAEAVNNAASKEVHLEYSEQQKFKAVEKYRLDRSNASSEREDREFPARFINSYQSTRASFKRQESVELQLRTQDGDIVTLSFSAKQSAKFKFDSAGSINYDPQALGSALLDSGSSRVFSKLFGSSALNISVQGNIDDGELAALEDLFGQLSEVFSAFFNGDEDSALQQALQLDFNAEEIAQFSVDLQLSERQKVVQRYREIADFGGETQLGNNGKGLNVGDYLQQIRDIAIGKVKTVEKNLLEQLLSISFAAGNLEQLDDGDIEEEDDSERSTPVITVDTPATNPSGDATELLI